MKLHILSDLHNEFSEYIIQKTDADILILAGDIGISLDGINFAKKYINKYKHIIYVPGNHEYYNQNLSRTALEMKNYAKEIGIVFLDNDYFLLEDTIFIGSTLWTDFRLYGDELGKIGYFMNVAKNGINDFNCIRHAHAWFTPSHCAQMSISAQEYIEKILINSNGLKKVVITHHAPTMKSIHEKYLGNRLNPCFANDLERLVEMSDFWIHGHVHDSFDYMVGKARVIANPRGYSKYQDKQENILFNSKLILNI